MKKEYILFNIKTLWVMTCVAALMTPMVTSAEDKPPTLDAQTKTAKTKVPKVQMTEVAPKLKVSQIPEIPARVHEALRRYQSTRSASFLDWTSNGNGVLISTRFGETYQVHRVARPGGAREQVTFAAEPISGAISATWEKREGFFFLKDAGGSEAYHLFFFDQATGRFEQVTQAPEQPAARFVNPKLSHDGRWLSFTGTARNGKDYDLWRLDLQSSKRTPEKLLNREGYWQIQDWSPDGNEMLLLNYISSTEASLHRYNITSGEVKRLMPKRAEPTYEGAGRYTADGTRVFFVSNRFGQLKQLCDLNLNNGRASLVTGDIPWDVQAVTASHQKGLIAFSVNEGGVSKIHVRDQATFQPKPLPTLPIGVLRSMKFSPKGEHLAVTLDSATGPADIYTIHLPKRALVRWTKSEVGGLDTSRFVAPKLISYPTFDQVEGAPRRIPAFYYKPQRAQGPHPVLIVIHGGPESQYRPRFWPALQHWINDLGIAIIAPNVRGSAGYGKDYLLLDNGMKREDSVRDIGALLDWIATQPELDAKRVAVYGGSYGGYMVLASMVTFADRLVAGAEIVGISNFVTFLKNTKSYRRDLRRAEYGDERDEAMRAHLESISPNNHAGAIADPMLVAQGANDPRVPASEAEQIVDAVRRRGHSVWYVLAEDEGHGFRKKKNRDYYYAALSYFWERYLVGSSPHITK
jgi:dipeptidyl aminopeptidase/acylaminoacyl peptidase